MVLFPPPFYFVFYISSLLSYIQNNFSYELARPIMGTIFLVNIYISREISIEHPSVGLASLAQLEKCFPLLGKRGRSSYFRCFKKKRERRGRQNKNNRPINLPKVITFSTDFKYTTQSEPLSYTTNIIFIYIHTYIHIYIYFVLVNFY